jgi:hypothetical protein
MSRGRNRLAIALAAVARRTPAFAPAYRPAPMTLGGQLWAGLTRNTPAFTGAQPPRAAVESADTSIESAPNPGAHDAPGSVIQAGQADGEQAAFSQPLSLREAELDSLLSTIQDAGPSSAQLAISTNSASAAMEFLATPESLHRFTVTIRIVPAWGYIVPSGVTFGLLIGGVYFLAVMAADGSATFRDVPQGEWELRLIRRQPVRGLDGPGVALPQPRGPADLAAADRKGTAILRLRLPDGQAELILHREDADGYVLEVIARPASETPLVTAVRYGTTGGAEQVLLIPVLRTALARLPDYDPGSPWQASPLVPPAQILAWEAGVAATSVRAAASNATRRAWRDLEDVAPGIRSVIDEEFRKLR